MLFAHVGKTFLQTVAPIGYLIAKSMLDFCFIQNRISWTHHRTGILIAMTRQHLTGRIAGKFSYGQSEIIPRANPFVAEMINAFVANKLPTLNDMHDNIGQISGVGGGSTLVENNLQLRLSLQERQHGLHKILAIFGI